MTEGEKMKKSEIKIVPAKVVYSHIKREQNTIRKLKYWLVVFATADILYTVLVGAMLYRMVTG